MKIAIKCLNLSVILLMIFAGTAVAAEWYESMGSSGIDQSRSVLKNIATSGSMTDGQDVQQAIAEIANSINVNREVTQVAESSFREQDTSRLTVNAVDADDDPEDPATSGTPSPPGGPVVNASPMTG